MECDSVPEVTVSTIVYVCVCLVDEPPFELQPLIPANVTMPAARNSSMEIVRFRRLAARRILPANGNNRIPQSNGGSLWPG